MLHGAYSCCNRVNQGALSSALFPGRDAWRHQIDDKAQLQWLHRLTVTSWLKLKLKEQQGLPQLAAVGAVQV